MTWIIRGCPTELTYDITLSGRRIDGRAASHEPIPHGNDFDRHMDQRFKYDEAFYQRLIGNLSYWTMYESTVEVEDAALYGNALVSRLSDSPNLPHCQINFFPSSEKEEALVGIVIFLPKRMFRHVWNLLASQATIERMTYIITIQFLGFRHPNVDIPVPSIQEFVEGRPYLTQMESFTLRPQTNDA